ncbi:MAG TPA: type IV pilus secretin PilQ [Candidatus Acidoferrales bacterium]|nr:type IV pilus secretin PilQ [Candidatus Acidoferrales bacterium]
MKTNGRARHWRVGALFLSGLMLIGLPVLAQEGPPAALNVQSTVDAAGVRLEAHANGPFEYSTFRASDTLYVVEMSGVALEGSGAPRVLNSDVVSGYRLLPYRAMGRSAVRLEVLLRRAVAARVERTNRNELVVSFDSAEPSTPAHVQPASATTAKPVSSVSTPSVSSQHKGEADGARIERVTMTKANEQVIVRVEASGKLNYQALRLNKPERLVLDFQGATVGHVQKPASVIGPVTGIRAAQFRPEMARLVIDLDRSTPYQVTADDAGLLVILGPSGSAAKAPLAKVEETQPVAIPRATQEATHEVAEVAAPAPEKIQSVTDVPVAPQPAIDPAPAPVEAKPVLASPVVMVDSGSMPLPQALTGETATLASPRPDDHTATTPAPATPTTPAAAPAPVPVAMAVDPGQPAARAVDTTASPAQKKYSGEPISVNLKDVDLKDFFRLIHEISGLNVVLDPAVRGNLTLVLDDVPWDQALDIVLQNNGLDKQLQGNVLRIATRDTLKREAEQQRDLSKAQNEAVPAITATRVLSYAKATAVVPTLKRFLSSRGDILADDRSNILIIRDIPSVFPDIDALLKQLDRKSQQVEIEARVVSASRTFSREIGVQFGISSSATGGRNLFGGLPGNPLFVSPIIRGPGLPVPPVTVAGSTAIPLVTNLPALTPNTGFSYAFSSTNVAVDLIISAAESRGVGKLLSKPKIVTQNNQPATVKQGQKIPVQTVINNTISTEFIDAVLRLQVTPQITADGTIYMDVDVENTQIDTGIPRVQGIPALDTQEAQTKVLVTDGGTVVIGGVIISSQQTAVDQTPFFGSIPVIGHLFRHTTVSTSSQELLFFITPRIIPS